MVDATIDSTADIVEHFRDLGTIRGLQFQFRVLNQTIANLQARLKEITNEEE
jgi:hypothetical protein